MEETGCEIICGASTTLAVKGIYDDDGGDDDDDERGLEFDREGRVFLFFFNVRSQE